jgi:hypothetical protein
MQVRWISEIVFFCKGVFGEDHLSKFSAQKIGDGQAMLYNKYMIS